MTNDWTRSAAILFVATSLAACGGEQRGAEETPQATVAEQPAGGMAGMQGMEGMQGMQMGGGMMEQMQAHMQAMEGESAEQFKANLPQHRQMVANMISQMNREMRDMNMTADQEWNSAINAVREDLKRLPEMSTSELQTFMPEHRQRVMRLMETHRGMMGAMQ
jgi:hypothetical protein